MQMNTCRNCNETVNWNYCPNCGQPVKLKRIDGQYLIQEIGDFFFANKGMLYTIKKVLMSPGESVSRFITEDRYRFVKPITFLFITSLVYSFVCYLFHIGVEDFYLQPLPEEMELPTFTLMMNWISNYSGYTSIISGFFVAFLIKLFFRKSGYNLFEIFILLCFASGITALFSSVVVIFQSIANLKLIHLTALISMIYFAWAIGQFFNRKKAGSYIKAFIACILGYLIFGFLVAFIAIFIDMM
jgi:hypothetical protein